MAVEEQTHSRNSGEAAEQCTDSLPMMKTFDVVVLMDMADMFVGFVVYLREQDLRDSWSREKSTRNICQGRKMRES